MNTLLNLTSPHKPLLNLLKSAFALSLLLTLLIGCEPRPHYDTIIRNGMLLDGSGNPGATGDLAISGDSIVAMGDLQRATADREMLAAVCSS